MRPYNIAVSALEAFYSTEHDWPGMIELLQEQLEQTQAYREALGRELYESLRDPEFSWRSALWNEDCHVEDFDTEQDARSFVEKNVLPLVERALTKPRT